jgi:hypothetical protein
MTIVDAFKQLKIYQRKLRARKVARYWKAKILAALLFGWHYAPGQLQVKQLDSLKANIDTFYQEKTNAEIEVFKTEIKRSYFDYLPSPSYSPFTGGFGLSLNLQPFIQARKVKKETDQRIKSIIALNMLETKSLKSEIELIYEGIKISIEDFNAKKILYDFKEKTFHIFEKQYSRNEITPTSFLSYQYEIEALKIQRRNEESLIRKDILNLYIKSKAAF